MAEPKIPQKGPYMLTLEAGNYFWCTCGRSESQPFCDGSHKGSEFSPQEFTVENTSVMAVCGCKHTKSPPFCDGSHGRL